MIISIDSLAEKIRNNIINISTKHKLKLVSVALEPDKATLAYLNSQRNLSKKLNINYEIIKTNSKEELIETIKKLNDNRNVNGIFLSQPLPFDSHEVSIYIDPKKDVEGITPHNLGNLIYGKSIFKPCTADSVVRILNNFTEIDGKRVAVIGRSVIVGMPVSVMLASKENNATVTICHSHTKNIKEITLNSDIIVAAVGHPEFITKDMVRENSIIIDVGINVVNGKIVGDVEKSVRDIAHVTEVPGGVGEITSLILFENLTKTILYK
ncbi:bifunctional 5,10-methylenetetrahydrofolate dehydrogenase/5,10-methenyltetrahydrofolate cyclohydrolase [Marinitoga aeolica]|uniref:Bifunctional protein FolD n=1 Tax=Marinitoga aeolica TaxID=2809031 RepID=A0ABY8PP42_9BACT|nr:bifunctional 5,10-methylenetetrahydrofolate dehydrogenase/5,10-methenyltetrahydrofolate cyclohydrolase [Marinitoga aeolica]WGS64392.1 bifunctional 5,10-methylenetetrahydrofolate dehydrogenase/5,10-methenyltetrahydrofolate cyclohydrolase [Marinitoga aeolica]